MRAAASYYYVCELGCESSVFTDCGNGKWVGNPCNSTFVKRYMRSLKRQKVRDGETQESVRAITSRKLEELLRFNANFPRFASIQRNPDTPHGRTWAGWRQRLMMSLMYAISFMCLLRLDEVLNIKVGNFRIHAEDKGKLELVLDFRKTHQTGEVEPFFLYFTEKEPWLNVPALLYEWLEVSGITEGYIFCSFFTSDQPKLTLDKTKKLHSTVFLNDFRRNLYEIGEDMWLYGGHSFRRGGAQYFIHNRGWNIRKLCHYGGWSPEFDSTTIVRYIIGVFDEVGRRREDYLDPDYQGGEECPHCGRTCDHLM
ncbi:hypothetical protein K469DRAFT_687868 [Zopfia rhizophila CBS 207.26]|uniref:Tyr recombinase domain-containing protein n=1 Tax=Zopfia rhizophila CBS 207.26 TaxID=1314779 RepID=A0A6A6E0T0_9PEZI|nr:hypothetical protein K469DRAFT_687868 [Zopfia rhizophila CBS 207.26]